ncbi:hypothetical protein AAMO2058_000713100 [Amorphochlora amoebiformis]
MMRDMNVVREGGRIASAKTLVRGQANIYHPLKHPERFMTSLVIADWSFGDFWALLITLVLLPFAIIVYLVSVILGLIPLIVMVAYRQSSVFPKHKLALGQLPAEVVRGAPWFDAVIAISLILYLPLMTVAGLWLVIIHVVNFILSYPIGVANPDRTKRSLNALRPFSGIPGEYPVHNPSDGFAKKYGGIWSFEDVWIAIFGAVDRQGFVRFLSALPVMIAFLPIAKIVICSNPFLFDLSLLYVNQWSLPIGRRDDMTFDDNDVEFAKRKIKTQVCRALLHDCYRTVTSVMPFTGHYPYPPESRTYSTACGVQYSVRIGTSLLTHSVHSYSIPDYKARSENSIHGFFSVYLQSWNPYHHVTGYVEVNLRADNAVEHPMWLLGDRNSRLHTLNIAKVNNLFVRLGHAFEQHLFEIDPYIREEMKRGIKVYEIKTIGRAPPYLHSDIALDGADAMDSDLPQAGRKDRDTRPARKLKVEASKETKKSQ